MFARIPTGLTLAEHRAIASSLEELAVFCSRYPVAQRQGYLQEKKRYAADILRVEMEEYISKEYPTLSVRQRIEMYNPPKIHPMEKECSFERVKGVLQKLSKRLSDADPNSAALKTTRILLTWVNNLSLFEKSQVNQRLCQAWQRRVSSY